MIYFNHEKMCHSENVPTYLPIQYAVLWCEFFKWIKIMWIYTHFLLAFIFFDIFALKSRYSCSISQNWNQIKQPSRSMCTISQSDFGKLSNLKDDILLIFPGNSSIWNCGTCLFFCSMNHIFFYRLQCNIAITCMRLNILIIQESSF